MGLWGCVLHSSALLMFNLATRTNDGTRQQHNKPTDSLNLKLLLRDESELGYDGSFHAFESLIVRSSIRRPMLSESFIPRLKLITVPGGLTGFLVGGPHKNLSISLQNTTVFSQLRYSGNFLLGLKVTPSPQQNSQSPPPCKRITQDHHKF